MFGANKRKDPADHPRSLEPSTHNNHQELEWGEFSSAPPPNAPILPASVYEEPKLVQASPLLALNDDTLRTLQPEAQKIEAESSFGLSPPSIMILQEPAPNEARLLVENQREEIKEKEAAKGPNPNDLLVSMMQKFALEGLEGPRKTLGTSLESDTRAARPTPVPMSTPTSRQSTKAFNWNDIGHYDGLFSALPPSQPTSTQPDGQADDFGDFVGSSPAHQQRAETTVISQVATGGAPSGVVSRVEVGSAFMPYALGGTPLHQPNEIFVLPTAHRPPEPTYAAAESSPHPPLGTLSSPAPWPVQHKPFPTPTSQQPTAAISTPIPMHQQSTALFEIPSADNVIPGSTLHEMGQMPTLHWGQNLYHSSSLSPLVSSPPTPDDRLSLSLHSSGEEQFGEFVQAEAQAIPSSRQDPPIEFSDFVSASSREQAAVQKTPAVSDSRREAEPFASSSPIAFSSMAPQKVR